MNRSREAEVLIAGAGPTGLTLACELARRGISVRLVEAAAAPSTASRGKGVQPRTLELFDDLGVLAAVRAAGGPYPRLRVHLWRLAIRAGRLERSRPPTPAVPYPDLWMVPQGRTEEILRERLVELGGRVEAATELAGFEQDGGGVSATLVGPAGRESVRAAFLVGCDGGRSFVRHTLGVRFEGEELPARPLLIADVEVEGVDRGDWHVWPLARGCLLTLCPLPGTGRHQLAAPLSAGTPVPELTEEGVRRFVATAIGDRHLRVTALSWASLYRPHVRLAERYRVGRVFLAGDAAHVHPPAGGQGLNTGVQDAGNLGWKLAAVLAGAPEALLDTYEEERRPIAAAVLGLSKRLQLTGNRRRGDTRQLGHGYRGTRLARDLRPHPGRVRAGDRAPDAPCQDPAGGARRLFDIFRGPHFTLLAFGEGHVSIVRQANARWGHALRATGIPGDLIDADGHARAGYDVRSKALVLVRPDGHIGLFACPGTAAEVDAYLTETIGAAQAGCDERHGIAG